jgi:hypothetical protein
MLSHCANSLCGKPFLRLGQGKLFLVERASEAKAGESTEPPSPHLRLQPRQVERYWLCDQCAVVWTLVHDRKLGIVLVPLPRVAASAGMAMPEQYRDSA